MNTTGRKKLTVKCLADRFGKDRSRIRQLCIALDLGTLIEGRIRWLTESDAKKISRFFAEKGHLSKNSQNVRHSG